MRLKYAWTKYIKYTNKTGETVKWKKKKNFILREMQREYMHRVTFHWENKFLLAFLYSSV